MKHSLKHGAGFLEIDHRNSPGLTPEQVAHVPGAIAVGKGRHLQRDILTCSHCERGVILQPLRTRDRGYCPKCNHYVCDECETLRVKTGVCTPMRQLLDRMLNASVLGRPLDVSPQAFAIRQLDEQQMDVEQTIRAGKALYDAGDWDAAEPYFVKMFSDGVTTGTVYSALSTIYLYQGRREEAGRSIRKAVALAPDYQANLDNHVMFTDADPATTPHEAVAARHLWWEHCGAPHYATRRPLTNDRDPNRRLRIGYMSGDFCHHSACTVFAPFALHHWPNLIPFYYSSTERYSHDAVTDLFKASPNWRDVWGESDEAVALQIREDRIDLLVDLSGYTANNRLGVFARKVAPVQITGWGYGTGLSWPVGVMDYLVADPTVVPANHDDITEQIALFPSVLPYFPVDNYPAVATPLPCLTNPPTFGVFQRALKINAETLAAWRTILERMPTARLIIKGEYCRSFSEQMARAFAPMLDRVSIIPKHTSKQEHLAMWSRIDVSLDTWPQSGGVASCEALWHGIPIVTYQGPRLMSRVASSLLTNLGLQEFIAHSVEEYVQLAIAAITNVDRLAAVRRRLPDSYAEWVERTNYFGHVESFYRWAWQTWVKSQAESTNSCDTISHSVP